MNHDDQHPIECEKKVRNNDQKNPRARGTCKKITSGSKDRPHSIPLNSDCSQVHQSIHQTITGKNSLSMTLKWKQYLAIVLTLPNQSRKHDQEII